MNLSVNHLWTLSIKIVIVLEKVDDFTFRVRARARARLRPKAGLWDGRYISLAALLLCCLLACAYPAPGAGASPAVHFQTNDLLEITSSGSARLTRRIGIGMDSGKPARFDISLVDLLPAGIHLLSPQPGILPLTGVDGKASRVQLSVEKAAASSRLRLDFHDLPSLPEGQKCCDCSGCGGTCGRACSVDFSYVTNARYTPGQWGTVQFVPSVYSLPVGKTTLVRVTLNVKPTALRNTALLITLPSEVNGARIVIKGHSAELKRVHAPPKLTRLSTTKTFSRARCTIELAITPTRPGAININGFAEMRGVAERGTRLVPILTDYAQLSAEQRTIVCQRQSLGFTCVKRNGPSR